MLGSFRECACDLDTVASTASWEEIGPANSRIPSRWRALALVSLVSNPVVGARFRSQVLPSSHVVRSRSPLCCAIHGDASASRERHRSVVPSAAQAAPEIRAISGHSGRTPIPPLRLQPVAYEAARTVVQALRRKRNDDSKVLRLDSDMLTSFLDDVLLRDFEPLLARLPVGAFEGASGRPLSSPDLRRFVITVARAIAENKQLLAMAADLRDLSDEPSDNETYRLVHYCLCIHLITRELAASPDLAQAVLSAQKTRVRSGRFWWFYLNVFEHFKLLTVEMALDRFALHRSPVSSEDHVPIPQNFGEIGVPFNVLEAVLQDFLGFRNLDNAWSGIALVMARPGRAGRPASVSADDRRAVQMHMPKGKAWKDLYLAWNTAFTASYPDAPYFSAAMFCPSVLGAPADEFMYHRTYSLYLHATAVFSARSRLGYGFDDHVMAERNWARTCRRSGMLDRWGGRNLGAARDYFRATAPQLGWADPMLGAVTFNLRRSWYMHITSILQLRRPYHKRTLDGSSFLAEFVEEPSK